MIINTLHNMECRFHNLEHIKLCLRYSIRYFGLSYLLMRFILKGKSRQAYQTVCPQSADKFPARD